MNILLTGGTGYIGSHAAVVFSEAGHDVVLLDNFRNSNKAVLSRIEKILGKIIPCIETDIRNTEVVESALRKYHIDTVVHFAGLKAVGESVANPISYYANNVQGSISLCEAMQNTGVKNLVFSSSATVYGDPKYLPYNEDHPTNPTSPYGNSKLHVEEILRDMAASDSTWRIVNLRYFNPVGAHESALIGEDPTGIPNNLMPYIAKVAIGELPFLNIFGNDYATKDGTGERDYVHVIDLAEGHLAALNFISKHEGCHTFNLGTGQPKSVLELLDTFSKVVEFAIPYKIKEKRKGDLPSYYADPENARRSLGWVARRDLYQMCMSTWKWQQHRRLCP